MDMRDGKMKMTMCLRLHVRGKIKNKRMGNEWNEWWKVVREVGLMGIERWRHGWCG